MAVRTLESPPAILPLYLRVAAPILPGASLLPFVPGGGSDVPDLELRLEGAVADPEALAAYARVCGFALRGSLPPTYPHILAFGLQMALMADSSFPFGAIGLVHLSNSIVQQQPIEAGDALDLRVRATPLQPHPKGRTFSLVTEARVGGELVWEETSTMLRRGRGSGEQARKRDGEPPAAGSVEWRLPGDLGRRYAAVSGDRNPIHIHPLTAKPLGFAQPIAHGMWTKARCLAALAGRVPDACSIDVDFRKPISLPGKVRFGEAADGEAIRFAVRGGKSDSLHLEGSVAPLPSPDSTKESNK